ncbi:nuclear receptor-interacting protein 2 [Syngnathoides biaculeatus]|uniref:nuclear receptor-interacting protein 2 n=1 Tax=Syngnathoides biaculeatus TaxID=300417 RepID=UPI002ADDF429|nr:nuclear receptor-interacting protein 2 [Syngnathoides biaculeatus]
MSEAKKGELAIRDKAILHQQRRLKQATQFTHKDSADLLPLDGLKRLGTSKDLQPHSIVQRRLLEGNVTRPRGEPRDPAARVRSPLADDGGEDGPADGEDDSAADSSAEESEKSLRSDDCDGAAASETGRPSTLLVQCKCCESDVKASFNTGSVRNRISPACCQKLGLSATASGSVSGLKLQLGSRTIRCSALVQEHESSELSLGLDTLLRLRCCLDLNRRVLTLGGVVEELPFLSDGEHVAAKKV